MICKTIIAAAMFCVAATAYADGELSKWFTGLPDGTDPATISRRVTDQFLTTRPENYKPAGYYGNKGYGWNRIVQYSVVSLWMNAIACARLTDDEYRVTRLVRLFDDFLPGGSKHKVCSRPRHVDDAIFGSLPLEIYIAGGQQAYDNKAGGQQAYNNKGNKACLEMGLMYADTQWCEPCEASFKERESAPPDVQREYYAKGLSVQTRLWIDDMYMITALQSQAYRATGDRKYIERAAAEMIFYLDKLQLKDGPAKGLFYHAPDVPFVWGRGDGWMAAGMALLLEYLPKDSPHRARIMDGYKLMMETLLKYQRKDGLWSQLIDRPDDPRNWGESSCTAMFTYAYLVGVRRGWLDGAKYGPSARRAYDALCARMDKWGNVAGTCEGTGKRNNLEYYFKRHQVNGDPHAQAPMLWIASTLLADGAGAVKGIKTPATSKLFETRVDPESGVVSYALVYGEPDDNRQSLYFITKSMTDDGRFLLFNYTVGNEKKPKRSPKILMVADLLNDTVKPVARAEKISRENIESRTPFVGDPFIECKENYVVFGSPKLGGFFRCDLAEPSKAVKLCGLPKGLDDDEYKAERYYTHLTLTKDRKRAFLDTALVNAAGKHRWVQGMLDIATGDFDKWGETPFCCNHGQINPADDTLAMCAWEACWEKDGQEYRKKTGWYPRMWLMKKGWREMIPAKDRNFASHEIWDDDGKGFSWCGRPGDYVYHHDLATGKQERWCGIRGARHNNVSPDKKYVVCDDAPEAWWRGCKWRVGFWNRETGKHVWLYSTRPPLMPRDNQSKMHPDPHPHFVMHGKYVVCTANNADGHMDLYVTPVAQMVEMTSTDAIGSKPAKQTRPKVQGARKALNIVNFVRSADPRPPRSDMIRAVREEVALNLKYGFKNTILLQYDALVDPEMMAEVLKSDKAKTEFGLWFEMSRPLNEAAGLPWKPKGAHKNWGWDWHINPGFLMAYDHAGRKAIIDAAFKRFKADFGYYPKSVGSWLLDAWSMDYMEKTYGVDGFCICREQDNTDAYGLRGGYSNGAYYPSKKNMLSAAVDMANAVKSPVFKMLTPDPIYNYGRPFRIYPGFPHDNPPTMEPAMSGGFKPENVDWYFRVYTEPKGLMNLSYMQAGQENSFCWSRISRGWPMQCAKIAKEAAAGHIVVEKMCETARAFKSAHKANCPQTQIALEDWSGFGRKSVWYNSRFYRANLIMDGKRLVFRDIHKMSDDFEEPFIDKVCTGWQALYYTPPVVDQWMFRGKGVSGVMSFGGEFASIETAADGDALVVTAKRTDGKVATVRFEEGRIVVSGAGSLDAEYEAKFRKDISVRNGGIDFLFQGYRYCVPICGDVKSTDKGFRISGDKIQFNMAK